MTETIHLAHYLTQAQDLNPYAKQVNEEVRFDYLGHSVTVTKSSQNDLSVMLKAPAHTKYAINSDFSTGLTFSPSKLLKALNLGHDRSYVKTLEVAMHDTDEPVDLKNYLNKWLNQAKLVKQVSFHGINGVAGVNDHMQVYFDGRFAMRGRPTTKDIYIDDRVLKVSYDHTVPSVHTESMSAGSSAHYVDLNRNTGDSARVEVTYNTGKMHLTVDLTQLEAKDKGVLFANIRDFVQEKDNALVAQLYNSVGISLPEVEDTSFYANVTIYKGHLEPSIDFEIRAGASVQPLKMILTSSDDDVRFRDAAIRKNERDQADMKVIGSLSSKAIVEFPNIYDIGQLSAIWPQVQQHVQTLKSEVTSLQSLSERSTLAKEMKLNLDDLQLLSGLQQ